jgi:hypothetical protein
VNHGGVISNNRTCQLHRRCCDQLHQSSLQIRVIDEAQSRRLVGASGLNVAGLLAAVADALRGGLLGAVAGQVTDLAAVVALLALGAVAAHVAETAAGVAGGLASTAVSALAALGTSEATTAAVAATVGATALGAVAGNVALLTALVALLATSATAGSTTSLGALTADVAGTTAAVAGLLGLGRGALAANVTLLTAVVAGWGTLGGALGSAVGVVTAWKHVSLSIFVCTIRYSRVCRSELGKGWKWKTSMSAHRGLLLPPPSASRACFERFAVKVR